MIRHTACEWRKNRKLKWSKRITSNRNEKSWNVDTWKYEKTKPRGNRAWAMGTHPELQRQQTTAGRRKRVTP